jgi:hypothetical protein
MRAWQKIDGLPRLTRPFFLVLLVKVFGRLRQGVGVDGVGLRGRVVGSGVELVEAVGERGGEEGGQGGEQVGIMVWWAWRTSDARPLAVPWDGKRREVEAYRHWRDDARFG